VWCLTGAVVFDFRHRHQIFRPFILAFLIIIMMHRRRPNWDGWLDHVADDEPRWKPPAIIRRGAGLHFGVMVVLRFCAATTHSQAVAAWRCSPSARCWRRSDCFALSKTAVRACSSSSPPPRFMVSVKHFLADDSGLTSEQCPRGGALTLNAVGGIGMLAAAFLAHRSLVFLQESSATKQLESANPALYQAVTTPNNYLLGKYQAIDPVKVAW